MYIMLNVLFLSCKSYQSLCIAVFRCFPLPSGQRPECFQPTHTSSCLSLPSLTPASSSPSRSSRESGFCFLRVFTPHICAFPLFPPSCCVFQTLFSCPGKSPLTISRLPSPELPLNHLLTLAHIYLLMQLFFYSSVPHFLKAQTIPVGVDDTF